MNDHLRQELSDWLEFYRDLGIEAFYQRDPGDVKTTSSPGVSRAESAAPAPAVPSGKSVAAADTSQAGSAALSEATMRGVVTPGRAAQSLSLFEPSPAPRRGQETLTEILSDLGDCHRCRLANGRKKIVFGQGNPRAELVFVGEGPGADEDEQGLPFVGRAGKLLNRMIEMAGMKREEVYIANIVKCRPPGNRVPEKDEIETCSPFLYRQIGAIRPKLVCCLGAPAVRTLLGVKEGITKIRGTFYDFGGAKALATVHPAYVLRNPREERILREDFEKIVAFLGRH